MKKSILYILIGVALLSGCDIESPSKDDLDGFWQVNATSLTWAFHGGLLELRDTKSIAQDILLRYTYQDGQLRVYEPRILDRDNDDPLIDDNTLLSPYGINGLDEMFNVKWIDGGKVQLTSGGTIVTLRRY